MEDVLEVYHRPHDPDRPVVCVDETSKQLIAETRVPIPAKRGQPKRYDYEYERNGTANLFMMFAPLEGWRHVKVTDRHTAVDYAADFFKELSDTHVRAKSRADLLIRRAEPPSDIVIERLNQDVPRHLEPAAQIVPERDAKLVAGLGQAKKRITAIAASIAACSGADLAPGHVAADVVLRTVGVERDLWPLQHHQQLRLVGMQPLEQAVQRDEAGAAKEDTVEPRAQGGSPARAWLEPVGLETGIEIPDQAAHPRLRGAMLVGEGVQLMHQPFRMDPAQRMPADVELSGIIAQHHAVAEEFVRLNAAPHGALGGDPHRVGRDVQPGEAEPVEMRQPGRLIGEAVSGFGRQAGDQRRGQGMLSHIAVGRVIEHVIGMTGA